MKKRIWVVISHLFHNFDLYAIMIAVIVITGLKIFGFAQVDLILVLTLDTLGIIALSMLRARMKVEKLIENLPGASSDSFFQTRLDLGAVEPRIRNVSTLDVLGASLINLSITNQAVLDEIKQSGGQVRLIVSNPDNATLQTLLSERYLEAETGEEHAEQVRTSLRRLSHLIGKMEGGGSIRVRVSDLIPSFSYLGTNTNRIDGNISVEIYLTDIPLSRNPIFILKAVRDSHWYQEFLDQFDFYWQRSAEIEM